MTARQAWWWLADYAWAGLAWVATLGAPLEPSGYATGTKTPVVVIPGVYENWQFVRPLIEALHAAGHPVHVLGSLGLNRRQIGSGAAALLEYVDRHDLHEVVVVGHSKGGLIAKLALTRDTAERIVGAVTICTPFHGSSRCRLLPLPSLRPLDPDDALICSLSANTSPNHRIVSLATPYDEHVPEGSHLVGATNLMLPVAGHFRPVGHPRALAMVVDAVGALNHRREDHSSVTA